MQIVCLCCARLPFCVHQTQDQTIMQQSPTYTLFLYQFNKSKSKINKIVLSVWIFALFFIYLSVCCAGAHFAHEVNTRRASRTQAEGVVWWNDWWSRTLSRAERRRTREEIATYAPEYAFSANESNIRQSITAKNTASSDSHSKAFYLMLRIEPMPTDSHLPTEHHMHENGGTSTFTLFSSSRFFMDRWVWIWE